jgi:osmotically-inducible protein OsmY
MRIITVLLILVLIMPMLVLAQGNPADDRIYDDVRRKLADDPDVRGAGLNVTVHAGKVVIEGRVHEEVGRQKATRIAKKVKGVTGVENKIKLFSEN